MPSSVSSHLERSTVLPLGHAPDWERIAERVRATAGVDRPTVGGVTATEVEREAVVLAFALFLAADAPGRATAFARTTARQLATTAGLREGRARTCLDLVRAAGIVVDPSGAPVVLPDGAPVWDDQIVARLADDLLRPAAAARVLRWDVIRDRAGGSTRALAASAAFIDLLPVPTEWTGVSLAAVGAVARYTGRKIGEAVQRAVECGVIDERRERGSASLYRFAAAALHGPVSPAPITRPASPTFVSPHARDSGAVGARPVSPPLPDHGPAGMRPVSGAATLMIGGVPFPLPPGARPELVQDGDGQYWYRVGSAYLGPVTLD